MASVTERLAALDDEQFRCYVTFDDVTMRITTVQLENDGTRTCAISAWIGTGPRLTTTCGPGQYITYTFKGNERYFYDEWSVMFELTT